MAPNGAIVVLDDEVASMGEAVERVVEAASALVEDRIELGRLELLERSSRIAASLACFGSAAFLAACAWVALLVAAALVLDPLLSPAASAAVVGAANLVLAGVLAWFGRRRITRGPVALEP